MLINNINMIDSNKKSSVNKKAKKTSKVKKSNEDTEVILSKPEQINVDSIIQQALLRYKNECIEDKKLKHKELKHLGIICEEYLSCFALIGYSLEHEKVVILNTPTSKDEAALVDLIRATFLDIANNRP